MAGDGKRWDGTRNRERLLDHGPRALREDAIDIVEHAIRAADPYVATMELLSLADDQLVCGGQTYDLREWEHIYVIGAGKATQGIALALEETLGSRIADGVVVLKRGESLQLERIRVVEAAHPIPDEQSVRGGREVMALARRTRRRDLVFGAITGGSSALLVLPPAGITLNDIQRLNEVLLACGASIREINAVRKHVSRIKGGRLGEAVCPAELINLTVSDVVGDALDYITGPTDPDTSTVADACSVLSKYGLWDAVPSSIRDHLRRGNQVESPKSYSGRYHSLIVVPGDAACRGAVDRSKRLGYEPCLLTTAMMGESREQALAFVKALGADGGDPRAVIAGGETTVTITGECGRGGPNQEFALSAAVAIDGLERIVVVSVDTDGTDGPTHAAGGLVDGGTLDRACEAGHTAATALAIHGSLEFLEATGDLVVTGPTGTNVNDLKLLLTAA